LSRDGHKILIPTQAHAHGTPPGDLISNSK
jgi:hypothetical protein